MDLTELNMGKENGTGNWQHEVHHQNIPGFDGLMEQICAQLVQKGLLNAKEKKRIFSRPDNDLVKIMKLMMKLLARGTKSSEFLVVMQNIDKYPILSSRVRKVIDEFKSSKQKPNCMKPMKRSNTIGESEQYQFAKRSRSTSSLNRSKGDIGSNEQKNHNDCILLIYVNRDFSKLKPEHQVIDMQPASADGNPKQPLSASMESLLDVGKRKIKKKISKSLPKKWSVLSVFGLGAFVAGAYFMSRQTGLAGSSSLGNAIKNSSNLHENGFLDVGDDSIKTFETRTNNLYGYRFY